MRDPIEHKASVTTDGPGSHRVVCTCGWKSKRVFFQRHKADRAAEQHAQDTQPKCGLRRLTEDVALQVVRQQQVGAYRCPVCPAGTWHTARKPISRRTA